MPINNAPIDPTKKPIVVPARLFPKFQKALAECPRSRESYAVLVSYCLRRGEFREVGEWITDFLVPELWAAGLERGFLSSDRVPAESDSSATNPA